MAGSPARLLGEPTGTSPKFVSTMKKAVGAFLREKGMRLEAGGDGKEGEQEAKITCIPLEGGGAIEKELKSACRPSK